MPEYEPWEQPDRNSDSPPQPFVPPKKKQNSPDATLNWVLIIALFAIGFWPVALYLLLRVLGGRPISWTGLLGGHKKTRRKGTGAAKPNPYAEYYAPGAGDPAAKPRKRRKKGKAPLPRTLVDLRKSRRFKIWGSILTAFGGFISLEVLLDEIRYLDLLWVLEDISFPMCILAVGLALLINGIWRGRRASRFERYLGLIGKNRRVSVRALAEAMPASQKQVCDDLQEMIARGYFAHAFLDVGHGVLVLSDEGIQEEEPPAPAQEAPSAPDPEPTSEPVLDAQADEFLRHIRAANDAIAHPGLSAKIDQIEELTRKIFTLLQEHPEKEKELRSFTGYYLPQTLKILDAYSKLEAQGVEGENITQAKQRIEAMMDKLVDGYTQQLDRLFSSDVLDITADIAVMESMLAKDGLTKEGVLYPEPRERK